MAASKGQVIGAAELGYSDATGRLEVWRDWALPGGRSGMGQVQRALGLTLTLILVWLLAMPPLALTAAAPRNGPANAPDVPGDEYWAAGFNVPGVNDHVHALAFGPDGLLYAGGYFTVAGEVAANHIARWNGSDWHSLDGGVTGPIRVVSTVRALTFGPDGSLYVGGIFATAGGVDVNNIARWDGTQWHPLGDGFFGGEYLPQASALAFGPDGLLYAGGSFTVAGGIAVNHIARWDGSQWHPLGSGMDKDVKALAFGPDGSLYAGGSFTVAGGIAANYIARWDGSQWHPLGSGMGGIDCYPIVHALAFGPDGLLYAGGSFTTAAGVAANSIARWDGSQWHPLGSGMGGVGCPSIGALAFGPDGSLFAGGRFTTAGGVAANGIARWDGIGWRHLSLGSGISEWGVYALALAPNGSLFAGGGFTAVGEIAANNLARWDGNEWHSVSTGNGMDTSVSALVFGPDGSLFAGGGFTGAGGVIANGIAHWDGARWHSLDSGMGGIDVYPIVNALAFGTDGSLYAGGRFTTAGGVGANHIARWDGSQWHPLGSGMDHYVYALAFGPDGSLYAGGDFTTAGGVVANHIARWDGSQWHPLGSGMDNYVETLAFGPDGSLYAGAGGVDVNIVARWDGSQWHALGSGTIGEVHALAFGPDGSLYAGGFFWTAGGVAPEYIVRWDGVQWYPLGSGMDQGVYALAFGPDGSLYAGGSFTTADGIPANRIAHWDGIQWFPLGSGMDGYGVAALAFGPDGSLYAGGRFSRAGDKPSSNIAQWTGEVPRPVAWLPAVLIDQ